MTNRAQITQQAARDGVPATTVERDYALAHIVTALGAPALGHGLVFKGGTALRLCYFEDYRYSADLDFSVVDGDRKGACATIDAALATVTGAIDALRLTDGEPRRIEYQGPLGRLRYLKLDLADDELVLDMAAVGLLRRWPDLPETDPIRVYSLEEIAAEKLRCVMQRVQCRDLLDLWRLFEDAGVDPSDAAEMFRPKAEHRGLNLEGFEASYRTRLAQYRHRWTTELEVHVPGDVPHFGEVERAVSRRLRSTRLLWVHVRARPFLDRARWRQLPANGLAGSPREPSVPSPAGQRSCGCARLLAGSAAAEGDELVKRARCGRSRGAGRGWPCG